MLTTALLFALTAAAQEAWPDPGAYGPETAPEAVRELVFPCEVCVTDEHLVAEPRNEAGSPVVPREQLALFLVGTGDSPSRFAFLADAAAYAGYHAVVLGWATEALFIDYCSHLDVDAAIACHDEYMVHVRLGEAARPESGWTWTADLYVPTDDSIEARGVEVLTALAAEGTGWERYLIDGEIDWSRVVVGGFSQGANHARRLADAHEVAGVVLVDGGVGLIFTEEAPVRDDVICTWSPTGHTCAPVWQGGATPYTRFVGIYNEVRDDPYERLVAGIWAEAGVGGHHGPAESADEGPTDALRLFTEQCRGNPYARTHWGMALEGWIPTDLDCDTAAVYPEDAGNFHIFPALVGLFLAAGEVPVPSTSSADAEGARPSAVSGDIDRVDTGPAEVGCSVVGGPQSGAWLLALIGLVGRSRR